MRKFIQNKLKDQKGLTLIELLAVIVILAIIAAIAIPAISNIIDNSRVGAMKSDNLNAIAATELYLLDNPTDAAVTLSDLTNKTFSRNTTTGVVTTAETTAGAPVYFEDAGSLYEFEYTVSTKEISSAAVQGKMEMDATVAIKDEFIEFVNSDRTTGGTIVVEKK